MGHDLTRRRPANPALNVAVSAPLLLVTVALGAAPGLAAGATDPAMWRYCLPSPRFSDQGPPPPADDAMHFSADFAEARGERYRLWGNVQGQRGTQRLFADQVRYDAGTDSADAEGNMRYRLERRLLTGERARLNLGDETGEISGARFWLRDRHLRGNADRLDIEGPRRMRLQSSLFTTCDEGAEFWRLKAARLYLDQDENIGVAHHTRLELLGLPVFYSPYLSFPLEGRKSGLLIPAIGDTSRSGYQIALPWYWNIAPNYDATLTPQFMSRRGWMIGGEFRYLTATGSGTISGSYLPGDRSYGADRSSLNIDHRGNPAPGWSTRLRYSQVSDGQYLDDFGNRLNVTAITHLERRADVTYANAWWNGSLMVQNYQTLDETQPPATRPYARAPQLLLNLHPLRLGGGLQLDARAELVRFEREAGVVGKRLDLQPAVSLPLSTAAAFLTPRLALRHTRYALQRTAPDSDPQQTRNLPVFSIDSGLFFERELSGGRASLQTLEPRLFYLYVPYVDQEGLIVDENGVSRVFDSSLPLLTLGQMFRDNRFNGADRVGDANQLSAVVTSRWLDPAGRELARAAIGRVVYFRDRRVTLPGQPVETASASNWLAEASSRWTPALSARLTLEWNQPSRLVDRGNASLRYHPGPRSALNLGYRFERDRLQQTDVSAMWPLWKGLSVVGRHRYSVQDKLLLEGVGGIEYESCCWTLRVLKRRYRVRAGEDFSDAFWLQLELKGLSSVGRNVGALLERDILAP